MNNIPISSTHIASVNYDPERQQLIIEFKNTPGNIYVFEGVPQEIVLELAQSSSPGGYFYANIRGKFAHTVLKETQA